MSRRRSTRKYTPYCELSPRRRRDAFIRLRGRVLADTPTFGGQFTSHQILDEPGRPVLFNQWFDFLFLGMDGRTIWNAEIITARRHFWDKVETLAWDRATALMSEEEQAAEFKLEFEPVGHRRLTMYRLKPRERRIYEAFGGLTFEEYKEQVEADIIHDEPPPVHESFRTDREYRYGIGLYIVVNAEEIDHEVVETAIARFRDQGETDWTAPGPIPRERLPYETEDATLAVLRAESTEKR
ncbi:hypothetical protein FHS51_003599 [Sphingobium wenxiniae]|uniref:Uncharacterized protein n=1 Tax=Sphingobium wenxiniae (strain DSM 21828 / CGMCC 1.7748 / JZ-1) TaxID=595605 RepID=A0A562K257_SPHWJ|nr:hypothetical protein [Sphingobium wenxiniae]MBB6193343.1 hypothetical protein [Sphingobium wenxiniae]TWH89510.1 hypothetical protein IQ35_03789 [Sphingobium wenxiniae]